METLGLKRVIKDNELEFILLPCLMALGKKFQKLKTVVPLITTPKKPLCKYHSNLTFDIEIFETSKKVPLSKKKE